MKTLTVKQPWASLIVAGIKDIENRTWATKYRGPLLIHAGATLAFNNIYNGLNDDQIQAIHDHNVQSCPRLLISDVKLDYPMSAIIGRVEVVDCVINHPSVWAERSWFGNNVSEAPRGEHEPDHIVYNWVLANPVQFDEPILNVKGKLSLWEWEGTS